MLATATVEIASETKVKVGAFSASNMTIPNGGVAEVAGCNDSIRDFNEVYGGGRNTLY